MTVEQFDDVARFYERVEPFWMQHEAENNFELGLAARLRNEPANADHFIATVSDGDRVVLAAMMTPPWPLVVSRGPDVATNALAEFVNHNRIAVNEVGGPVEATWCCAQALARLSDRTVTTKNMMRIMQTQRVIPPQPVSGSTRVATLDDLDLVLQWMEEFGREIGEAHDVPRQRIEQRVTLGEYSLWIDRVPVSIAACTGPTPNGIRINAVYTPPQFRDKGYASNCVAQLTRKQLDSGRKFCFLYTDAANPISNKIYERMGYEFVCDWTNLKLV